MVAVANITDYSRHRARAAAKLPQVRSLFWASRHSVAAEILLDTVTLRLSSQCSITHPSHKIEWEIREINHNYYPVSFVPKAIANAVPFAWKAHLSELLPWRAHHVGHSLNVITPVAMHLL